MKFKVSVKELQDAVKAVHLATNRSEDLPAQIHADSTGVTITGAGLAGMVAVTVPGEVDGDGAATVAAASLVSLAGRLTGMTCSVELAERAVVLQTESQKLSLGTVDIPMTSPETHANEKAIDGRSLADAIKRASLVADREGNARLSLSGVQIAPSGEGLNVTGTNGRVLVQVRVEGECGLDGPVIVPLESIPLLLFALSAECSIGCIRKAVLSVKGEGSLVNVGLADGRFPTVEGLFADDTQEFSAFDADELLNAVTTSATVSRGKFSETETVVSVGADGLEVSSSGHFGVARTKVSSEPAQPKTVKVNPHFFRSVVVASAGNALIAIDGHRIYVSSERTRAVLVGINRQ